MRQAPSSSIVAAARAHISDFVEADPIYAAALERAAVLIIGSWSFGLGDKHSDLDLLVLLRDREYEALSPRLSMTARTTVAHAPILTAAKIRSVSQVVEAFEPVILWFVLKNAHCLRDYDGTFNEVRARSEASFLTDLPNVRLRQLALLRRQFDWLRYSAERTLGSSYQLMVADFVQYVWELLFLHDGEPYPYTKWIHSRIATLPSYSAYPSDLVATAQSLLGMTEPVETLAQAQRLTELLLGWLATTEVAYKSDLLDLGSEAYYGLLP